MVESLRTSLSKYRLPASGRGKPAEAVPPVQGLTQTDVMGNAASTGMDRDAELLDRLAVWQERYRAEARVGRQ
jgi:hypothetical protein